MVDERNMNMEQWPNDSDGGKSRYSVRDLSECHFSYQKCSVDLADIEPWSQRREAGDETPEPWHDPFLPCVGGLPYNAYIMRMAGRRRVIRLLDLLQVSADGAQVCWIT